MCFPTATLAAQLRLGCCPTPTLPLLQHACLRWRRLQQPSLPNLSLLLLLVLHPPSLAQLLLLLLLWRVLLPRLALRLRAAAHQQLLHVSGSIHPTAPNHDGCMEHLPPKDSQRPRQALVCSPAVCCHPV
jgi:hypothetical protein